MTCVFVRVLAVGFLGPGRHFGLVFMGCTQGGSINDFGCVRGVDCAYGCLCLSIREHLTLLLKT